MKTTRKRRTVKASRKAGKASTAQLLQDNAGNALRRGRETIGRAYDWANEATEGSRLRSLRMPRRSDIGHLSEANPLLLGAVGLGLGVAIGTLFPRGLRRHASGTRRKAVVSTPAKKTARKRRKKNGTAASA